MLYTIQTEDWDHIFNIIDYENHPDNLIKLLTKVSKKDASSFINLKNTYLLNKPTNEFLKREEIVDIYYYTTLTPEHIFNHLGDFLQHKTSQELMDFVEYFSIKAFNSHLNSNSNSKSVKLDLYDKLFIKTYDNVVNYTPKEKDSEAVLDYFNLILEYNFQHLPIFILFEYIPKNQAFYDLFIKFRSSPKTDRYELAQFDSLINLFDKDKFNHDSIPNFNSLTSDSFEYEYRFSINIHNASNLLKPREEGHLENAKKACEAIIEFLTSEYHSLTNVFPQYKAVGSVLYKAKSLKEIEVIKEYFNSNLYIEKVLPLLNEDYSTEVIKETFEKVRLFEKMHNNLDNKNNPKPKKI